MKDVKAIMLGYSVVLGLFLLEQMLSGSDEWVLMMAPLAAILYKTNTLVVRYF